MEFDYYTTSDEIRIVLSTDSWFSTVVLSHDKIDEPFFDVIGYCDCGSIAKWVYMPQSNLPNPFFCGECVPRGCECGDDPCIEYYPL